MVKHSVAVYLSNNNNFEDNNPNFMMPSIVSDMYVCKDYTYNLYWLANENKIIKYVFECNFYNKKMKRAELS